MRVLVTGGAGFIGRRIMDAAEREGWAAVGTSRNGIDKLIGLDVADISSFSALRDREPFDAIVHCAGIAHRSEYVPDTEYERVNVEGTKNVAKFAATTGAKHLVFLSSVMVYGRHGINIGESEECDPGDAYAASKLQGEQVAAEICSDSGIALTVLRPAPVIGEGCKGNFARLVRAIDRGHFVNVGNGSNRKSMIYVGDVAEAVVRAIELKGGGVERFNIAADPITTGELLSCIYESLGKRPRSLSLPLAPLKTTLKGLVKFTQVSAVRSVAKSLETWTSDDVYSTQAIKDRYGIVARISLEQAVRRTVGAYRGTTG